MLSDIITPKWVEPIYCPTVIPDWGVGVGVGPVNGVHALRSVNLSISENGRAYLL